MPKPSYGAPAKPKPSYGAPAKPTYSQPKPSYGGQHFSPQDSGPTYKQNPVKNVKLQYGGWKPMESGGYSPPASSYSAAETPIVTIEDAYNAPAGPAPSYSAPVPSGNSYGAPEPITAAPQVDSYGSPQAAPQATYAQAAPSYSAPASPSMHAA